MKTQLTGNRNGKHFLAGLAITVAMFTGHETSKAAGPDPINLRSAGHFTILSGAAITTTGGGIINGDVGASPITGGAIGLTAAQVNGIIYSVDASGPTGSVMDPALLDMAKADLTTAYNEAAGRGPTPSGPFLNPGAGNIGGMSLIPGLYKFTSTASITGADVTLTGGPDDVWIFQIASDLQMGSMRNVILAGGAQARNIFWQVGTTVSIGTFSVFKGTILAYQSIVMNTSSVMDGRALAFNAGVTFNGDGGSRPTPQEPRFANITTTSTGGVVMEIGTTPYLLLTLQSSPDLASTNWTTLATATPMTSSWTFTNVTATSTARFYRAFLTR